jgi:uncharacterized membrane protein YphA (DoxX/SURF4 family)
MRKLLSNDYVNLLCRLIFGSIFIYASLDKITHPDQFARIVYNYHLLPGYLVNVAALILPVSEFLAGVFLIVGFLYEGSRNYLLFLMAVFMIALGVNIIRGVDLECGCFTVSSRAKSAVLQLIVRDVVYAVPGVILLFSRSRRWILDRLFL